MVLSLDMLSPPKGVAPVAWVALRVERQTLRALDGKRGINMKPGDAHMPLNVFVNFPKKHGL